MNKIACFLTCGHTEAGAMQAFLRKINAAYDYRQWLPNKTVKKKGMPKKIDPMVNGLTGTTLIRKVMHLVEAHKEELKGYVAILIEDDMDDRFVDWSDERINAYKKEIHDTICGILQCDIPVFFLYAAPEIESWFLADWNHSFGYVYGKCSIITDLDNATRIYFVHHLKQYIDKNIIKRYCQGLSNIETFAEKTTNDSNYLKLSELLADAVHHKVVSYIGNLPGCNEAFFEKIVASKDLYYSKSLHGDLMLREIEPTMVARYCRFYFAEAWLKLHNL